MKNNRELLAFPPSLPPLPNDSYNSAEYHWSWHLCWTSLPTSLLFTKFLLNEYLAEGSKLYVSTPINSKLKYIGMISNK
jgi:hypothetical protein